MTARQAQIACEELREELDATNERVRVLEEVVAILKPGARPAPANTNGRPTNGTPRWLSVVRFPSACAGTCGTVIPQGPGRAWYEPKTATHKAQLFCEPCGAPRAKANGVTP